MQALGTLHPIAQCTVHPHSYPCTGYIPFSLCEYLFSVLCIEFAAVVKEEEFPEFYGWVERMKGTDAVKGSYQPPEAHLAFMNSVKAGVHDYSHADVTGQGITIYAKE